MWWSSDEDEPDNVADPPILIDLTDEEVESFAENTALDKYQLPPIPCHSQAVEWHVKLLSETSKKASLVEQVDGIIRATLRSRKLLPVFETRKDYSA